MADNNEPSRLRRQSSFKSKAKSTLPSTISKTDAAASAKVPQKLDGKASQAQTQQSKPKFTAEEQIEIFKRLKAGNYMRGAGLEQFRRKETSQSQAASLPCKKNLGTEFAKLDSKSAHGSKNLESSSAAGPSSKIGHLDLGSFTEVSEDYSDLPEYIKFFNSVVLEVVMYYNNLHKLAEVEAKRTFSKAVSRKYLGEFFTKMEKLTKVIEKFNKLPEWEKAEFFMPHNPQKRQQRNAGGAGSTRSVLYCDVREQENFMKTMKKISENLDKMNALLDQPNQLGQQLPEQLDNMASFLNAYEDSLKEFSNATNEYKDLVEKLDGIKLLGDKSDGGDSEATTLE